MPTNTDFPNATDRFDAIVETFEAGTGLAGRETAPAALGLADCVATGRQR